MCLVVDEDQCQWTDATKAAVSSHHRDVLNEVRGLLIGRDRSLRQANVGLGTIREENKWL
jgi:hypothetical protein